MNLQSTIYINYCNIDEGKLTHISNFINSKVKSHILNHSLFLSKHFVNDDGRPLETIIFPGLPQITSGTETSCNHKISNKNYQNRILSC
jgi:hypothetical protein